MNKLYSTPTAALRHALARVSLAPEGRPAEPGPPGSPAGESPGIVTSEVCHHKERRRRHFAILIKSAVIALSYAFLKSYLLEQSHGALSQRAVLLPIVFVAGALVVGMALGLWVNQRPE